MRKEGDEKIHVSVFLFAINDRASRLNKILKSLIVYDFKRVKSGTKIIWSHPRSQNISFRLPHQYGWPLGYL